jgi:hypothetical protein
MTIWQYPLKDPAQTPLRIPIGGKILSLQVHYGTPCLYVLVDPKLPSEYRRFRVHVTGGEISVDDLATSEYVGSFQLSGGAYTHHLFEVTIPSVES